jgi:nicotinamidase-related amidase
MNDYVLVVIDMQPYFESSQGERVIANCQREIREARARKNYILFLEYENCGRTDQRLLNLVQGYPHTSIVIKADDDGSEEITKELRYKNFRRTRLRVCGVNTDICVFWTVVGLEVTMPNTQVEVVFDACDSHVDHDGGIDRLKQLNNVQQVVAA